MRVQNKSDNEKPLIHICRLGAPLVKDLCEALLDPRVFLALSSSLTCVIFVRQALSQSDFGSWTFDTHRKPPRRLHNLYPDATTINQSLPYLESHKSPKVIDSTDEDCQIYLGLVRYFCLKNSCLIALWICRSCSKISVAIHKAASTRIQVTIVLLSNVY